ncbi:hypothetical protein EP7_005684 (plasmid) [Isosphaeraceae bacterium EP7]
MAYERGGIADKLGNRFEKLWVVQQLLHLLAGHIQSVKYEAVGPDEVGVDLWISRPDGRREAHQCKGFQGTKPEWSIADLARRGILGNLRYQLEQDLYCEFSFISTTSAGIFRDLADSSRMSENSDSYWEYQIKARSKAHREGFRLFRESLGLLHDVPEDLEIAYRLLRRSHYLPFSDDVQTRRNLEALAACYVSGPSDRVLDALRAFSESDENLRREIYADDVYAYLLSKGHPPRDLARDGRLPVLVGELIDRFTNSIRPHLAAKLLIPRRETQAILEWIAAPGKERLLILHGPAGGGKSGILFELTEELHARGIPFLPLRLDRQPPKVNAQRFGEDCGLPGSPALCLHAVAGNRTAVLVIDQLDALRWTSAHSSEAFSICQEMVRQAMHSGGNLLVVMGCRTFDLENDPQIKKWQQGLACSRNVPVEPLPEATIREVAERAGVPFDSLTRRERQLLSNVQNLTMWAVVAIPGVSERFSTVTELSRQFWKSRWEEISRRGIPTSEVEELLDRITTSMETRSRLDAPGRLMEGRWAAASEALQSLNVLQVAAGKVSFCHQSYLDYQISNRLLEEIDDGRATVQSWLGAKDGQSLYRRERLRLILLRMRDENPSRFLDSLRGLLFADDVRFHLKQVALQCLGMLDDPSAAECDLMIELLRLPDWRNHASDQILMSNESWFEALDDRGQWRDALASGDDSTLSFTLQLIRAVAPKCGDRIAKLLSPHAAEGGDWPWRCTQVIWPDPLQDSDALFDFRVRLAHLQADEWGSGYLPELARQNAGRFIRLVEARVMRKLDAVDAADRGLARDRMMDRLDQFPRKERAAFRASGRAEPGLALDRLLPLARRIAGAGTGRGEFHRHGGRAIPVCISDSLIAAGAAELRQDADRFFRRIGTLRDSEPPVVQAIILAALTWGPEAIADRALGWLIDRPASLRTGDRFEGSIWEPARRLIFRHSRRCSDQTFSRLEAFLLRYSDDEERRSMIDRHERVRRGNLDYPNRHGQTQYHLLPALESRRKSDAARGREAVVRRKFDAHNGHMFSRNRSRGGGVTSPIFRAANRLSDAAWLDIIGRNSTDRRPSTTRYGRDYCIESSPGQFAIDLANATHSDPARFARLALRIPAEANPAYLNGLLGGLSHADPPQNLTSEQKRAWKSAALDVLQPVIAHAMGHLDLDSSAAFARILTGHSDLKWPAVMLETVLGEIMGLESRDSSEIFGKDRKGDAAPPVDDLHHRSINCLRGQLAATIESLLWSDIGRISSVKSAMELLVVDDDPAVRVAAIGACGPAWNADKDLAAGWFAAACDHADDRVMACRDATHLFQFIAGSHPGTAEPILRRMIGSAHPEVTEAGACHATFLRLCGGQMVTDAEHCRAGTAAQRRGVARAAVDLLDDDGLCLDALGLLIPLCDDEDEHVRRNCDRIFQVVDLLDRAELRPLLEAYVRSRGFLGNQWNILQSFAGHTGSLLPLADILMGMIEVCAGPLLAASRDLSTRTPSDLSEIGPLLVRLYEQAEGGSRPDVQRRCLDAWDVLLERRVGVVRTLMHAIDQ